MHVITCCKINFRIPHISGSVITAADFLSILDPKVTEKIRLKIREDIKTTPIEVTNCSSNVADEEQLLFTQADKIDESEQQSFERKKQSRPNTKQWAAHEKRFSLKTSLEEFTKINGNTTSYSANGIKTNARILVEQDVDLVLKQMNLKTLGQALDEVIMMTNSQDKHYKANEDRIFLKDSQMFRKYFGETGNVKYYQIPIPKQILNEVLRSLHGVCRNHPGSSKTIIAYSEKCYFPKMAQLIGKWIRSCEQCIRESRIDRSFTHPPL